MKGWRELADEVRRGDAVVPPPTTETAPPGIPVPIAKGLSTLRTMPTPRIKDRSRWRPVVMDADRLVSEGWAAQALALGWHPLELFGWGLNGDDRFDGLAVWLGGRRIIVLDDSSVVVRDGDWRRIFNRQRPFVEGGDGAGLAAYLWQVQRG